MNLGIKINEEDYNRLVEALRPLEKTEESGLKTAVNNTTQKARKELAQRAKDAYGGEAPQGILGRSSIAKATVSNIEAVILFRSKQHSLTSFRTNKYGKMVTPVVYTGRKGKKKRKTFAVKATQLKNSNLKLLKGKSGSAFVVRLANGKLFIASRTPDKAFSGRTGNRKIRVFHGSSDMAMVRNEKVYGTVQDKIGEQLHTEVLTVIEKALGSRK